MSVRRPRAGRRRVQMIETLETTTPDLVALDDRLSEQGVTQVAMEGTGVYGKPVCDVREEHVELWLENAQHVKNVPARIPSTSTARVESRRIRANTRRLLPSLVW